MNERMNGCRGKAPSVVKKTSQKEIVLPIKVKTKISPEDASSLPSSSSSSIYIVEVPQ